MAYRPNEPVNGEGPTGGKLILDGVIGEDQVTDLGEAEAGILFTASLCLNVANPGAEDALVAEMLEAHHEGLLNPEIAAAIIERYSKFEDVEYQDGGRKRFQAWLKGSETEQMADSEEDYGYLTLREKWRQSLDKTEFELCEATVKAWKNHQGSTTPIEDLIYTLLLAYSVGSVGAERVECALEEFRANWQTMEESIGFMAKVYPAMLNAALEKHHGTAEAN